MPRKRWRNTVRATRRRWDSEIRRQLKRIGREKQQERERAEKLARKMAKQDKQLKQPSTPTKDVPTATAPNATAPKPKRKMLTFKVDEDVVKKMRDVVYWYGARNQQDLLEQMLLQYIDEMEKEKEQGVKR